MTAHPAYNDDRTALQGAVFDAVAEALAIASGYVEIAARSAELQDPRSLAYAVRSASAALITAGELTAELRTAQPKGQRP